MAVQIIDHGYNRTLRAARRMGELELTVGVHESDGEQPHGDGDLTLLDIAILHEFGDGDLPERSFVRGWATTEEGAIRREMLRAAELVFVGRASERQALNALGEGFAESMRGRMTEGIAPALEPETAEEQGDARALNETGQLIASIKHEVK